MFRTEKILSIITLLSVAACGYSLRDASHLPFQTVNIVSITNKTEEPNIEDIMAEKLAEEFGRQGIGISGSSPYNLTGEITEFSLRAVAAKNEFSREYEVVVRADFRITGPDGFLRSYLSKTSPFIESFVAERALNAVVSLKEIATETAVGHLADALVTELIYR